MSVGLTIYQTIIVEGKWLAEEEYSDGPVMTRKNIQNVLSKCAVPDHAIVEFEADEENDRINIMVNYTVPEPEEPFKAEF